MHTYKILALPKITKKKGKKSECRKIPQNFSLPSTPQFEGIAVHSRCKLYWLDGENEKFISHAERKFI